MRIVGCDFHPAWQQVSVFDPESGEIAERKLLHGDGEAERFYRELESPALIGIEACGNSQWFIELAESLGHVVWIGDAAQIRASYVRRQKTDRRDAGHILKLLLESRFPRLWTPTAEQRDLRQLLVEAAQSVNRLDEGFQRQYFARCHHKAKGVAKVAAARKLAVRLYWMLRQNVGYPEIALIESSSRVPLRGESHLVTLNERSRTQQ
jgi:hypothetical protein